MYKIISLPWKYKTNASINENIEGGKVERKNVKSENITTKSTGRKNTERKSAKNKNVKVEQVKSVEWANSENNIEMDVTERLPLYGPLNVEDIKRYYKVARKRFMHIYTRPSLCQVSVDKFDIKDVLGKGAFGKVMLVKDKDDHTYFAMKALEKRHLIKTKQIQHALNEKRILEGVDFPFGVRMEHFSKDNSYIYYIMPFISGGELFNRLTKVGNFDETTSKIYAAQVVLGLEYLHYLSLIYRDLKPENLLIDQNGFLKITDFGFTKVVPSRTYTFCGTPQYIAPEVIAGQGYGRSVDWWSLGVLIYEMNCGYPPYNAPNQMAMFKLILSNRYVMPVVFSAELKDIVKKLLQVDITKRYGNLRNGVDDIKNHNWFLSVNWVDLFNRRVNSPFIPTTAAEGDVRHFETLDCKDSYFNISDVNEFEKEFKDF